MKFDTYIFRLISCQNNIFKKKFRLKALIREQAFSRQLHKELVASGTSEIESYSEEEFSNIPDRPDRDRLLKMVSQDSLNHSKPSTDEEGQIAAEKLSKMNIKENEQHMIKQEQQQKALLKLQQDAKIRKEEDEARKRIEDERVRKIVILKVSLKI